MDGKRIFENNGYMIYTALQNNYTRTYIKYVKSRIYVYMIHQGLIIYSGWGL